MLAVKFLEICVLLFSSDVSGGEVPSVEGKLQLNRQVIIFLMIFMKP